MFLHIVIAAESILYNVFIYYTIFVVIQLDVSDFTHLSLPQALGVAVLINNRL